MAQRLLQDGSLVLFDDKDGLLAEDKTLYRGSNGYVYYSEWSGGKSRPDLFHLLIMGKHPGMHVDHRDGDPLNCHRNNLRVVTYQKNQVNRHRLNRNNTSGVRGVTLHRPTQKWLAQIMVDRKSIYLGLYADLEDAVVARQQAEWKFFGELCPTNS